MVRLLACALSLVLLPDAAIGQDELVEAEHGYAFLKQDVVVDTDLASAWALYTTAEGVTSWIAPVAQVDLRPGGSMRTHYDAGASVGDAGTIETRIVNYIPERLLTLQADLAPVEADWLTDAIRAEAGNLYNVIEFEPLGPERTRIVSWGIGYRTDPEWQPMIAFFTRANRWTLDRLQAVVATPGADGAAD